jgi:hypothetical protein
VPATTEGDPLYEAIEVLLKGPEVDLADHGLSPYVDKDGHARHRARVAWWRKDAKTLHVLAVMDGNFKTEDGQRYPKLPDVELDSAERSFCYRDDVPLFDGHYWRTYPPRDGFDFTAHTACLDFTAVKDGTLVATAGTMTPRSGRIITSKPADAWLTQVHRALGLSDLNRSTR